uniref:Pentraxin family member n=1 Tax=Salarias fasciatus TaxID=181472 RepID=A0A672JD59_SALFA
MAVFLIKTERFSLLTVYQMAFLLLFVMLTACAASPQDLSGQVFTFPEETNTTYVRLNASVQSFSAVTVCLRFITDLSRSHSLFSLATPSAANAFQIRTDPVSSGFIVFVNNRVVRFWGLNYTPNRWHSICSTWDGDSGLVRLWFDSESTVSKFAGGTGISEPVIILGQDQDSLGGRFQARQSFVGMLSNVHMWDYTLSACEIQNYVDDLNFGLGNVLNWRALEFKATGRVLLEDKMLACH